MLTIDMLLDGDPISFILVGTILSQLVHWQTSFFRICRLEKDHPRLVTMYVAKAHRLICRLNEMLIVFWLHLQNILCTTQSHQHNFLVEYQVPSFLLGQMTSREIVPPSFCLAPYSSLPISLKFHRLLLSCNF